MTPFGALVVPDVKAIRVGPPGRRDRAGHRFVGEQLVEVPPDQADDRNLRTQIGLIGHPAELLGADEHPRFGGGQDVRELFAAVEVHDRHQHRAQERRRPERRGGLHPVRQLKCHHVTGADAAGAQPRREATGHLFDLAECPRPWPYRRIGPKPRIRSGVQSTGQHLPEGLAGPPPRTLISGDQFSGNIAHWLKAPTGKR